MFNVWLPAVLENRAAGEGDEAIRSALKEFVLYSSEFPLPSQTSNVPPLLGLYRPADTPAVAGCPGSILGAWMIQTRLGRRKSLAIWAAATGIATFAFIRVKEDYAVIISSMIISASATAMYAVLCECGVFQKHPTTSCAFDSGRDG